MKMIHSNAIRIKALRTAAEMEGLLLSFTLHRPHANVRLVNPQGLIPGRISFIEPRFHALPEAGHVRRHTIRMAPRYPVDFYRRGNSFPFFCHAHSILQRP